MLRRGWNARQQPWNGQQQPCNAEQQFWTASQQNLASSYQVSARTPPQCSFETLCTVDGGRKRMFRMVAYDSQHPKISISHVGYLNRIFQNNPNNVRARLGNKPGMLNNNPGMLNDNLGMMNNMSGLLGSKT